jgi:hypothetical protein
MTNHLLHHTSDLEWITLSPGISFKPIVFFPKDTGYQLLLRVVRHTDATTARAAYVEWCTQTGTAVHPDLASRVGVSS